MGLCSLSRGGLVASLWKLFPVPPHSAQPQPPSALLGCGVCSLHSRVRQMLFFKMSFWDLAALLEFRCHC